MHLFCQRVQLQVGRCQNLSHLRGLVKVKIMMAPLRSLPTVCHRHDQVNQLSALSAPAMFSAVRHAAQPLYLHLLHPMSPDFQPFGFTLARPFPFFSDDFVAPFGGASSFSLVSSALAFALARAFALAFALAIAAVDPVA